MQVHFNNNLFQKVHSFSSWKNGIASYRNLSYSDGMSKLKLSEDGQSILRRIHISSVAIYPG